MNDDPLSPPILDRMLADMVERNMAEGWKLATFCRDCLVMSEDPLDEEAFVALPHEPTCRVRLASERHEYMTLWKMAEANLRRADEEVEAVHQKERNL